MFQQTFLQTPESHRKPYSMGISLLLQAAALTFLAVLPLLYSPGLPGVELRSLLLAPPPPSAPVAVHTATTASARVPTTHRFVFRPDTLEHVAQPVAKQPEVAAAPGIDFAGGSTDANGSASSIVNALGTVTTAPPPPKPVVVKAVESKPVRLGGVVAEANLIQRVQPVYPLIAKAARVSGSVEFSATISRAGTIENLQLLHGHTLLVEAAKQAILQWRYKPTLLNGQPVEVITNIVVTFTLN